MRVVAVGAHVAHVRPRDCRQYLGGDARVLVAREVSFPRAISPTAAPGELTARVGGFMLHESCPAAWSLVDLPAPASATEASRAASDLSHRRAITRALVAAET